MKPYVDVMGVKYRIEIHDAKKDIIMEKNHLDGYCSNDDKLIAIADLKILYPDYTEKERENYQKHLLRHEVIHAFLEESGLSDCSLRTEMAWARNEEMVDWIAIQFPKMLEAFKWLEVL